MPTPGAKHRPAGRQGALIDKRARQDTATSLEVIEAIHRQVQAEQETAAEIRRQNDLAEKSLGELQRTRLGQQQRIKLAFDTNDKVSGLLTALEGVFEDIRQISRRLLEAERRAERTDDILLLLLTEHSPQKITEAREDLEAEIADREKHQLRMLRQHKRNLARLQEQAAGYGALGTPLELQNRIEAEHEAIALLQQKRLT